MMSHDPAPQAVFIRRRTALGLAASGVTGLAAPAWGQQVSADGILSEGCAMHWRARARINSSLPDNSLNEFMITVRPTNNQPGIMEVQHWSSGSTLNWRIPIGTSFAVKNAVATLTLPTVPAGTTMAFVSDSALTSWIVNPPNRFSWGTLFTWGTVAASDVHDNGNGTWTIDLGDLPAGAGRLFQLVMTMPVGTSTAQDFDLDIDVKGTYGYGSPSSCQPAPVPANHPMALLGLGALSALAAGWHLRGKRSQGR